MTDITKIIFDSLFESDTLTPELRSIDEEYEVLIDKIRPVLGKETSEALLANHDTIVLQSIQHWFCKGIRVGMALMQELL